MFDMLHVGNGFVFFTNIQLWRDLQMLVYESQQKNYRNKVDTTKIIQSRYIHKLVEDLENQWILAICVEIVMRVVVWLVVSKNIILYYISSCEINFFFLICQ